MALQNCTEFPEVLIDVIEQFVRSRTGGSVRGLHVDIREERFVISGRTATYYNKQLATHAAMAAMDGISLTNEIEVC